MEIEAREIRVRLDGTQILNGTSITVGEGRFVGLIGPNGSGKTTLLKCIYRALKPSGGAVFLDGKALSAYSVKESARKSGVVAQHSDGGFEFTVLEMVMLGRAPHKRALERDSARDNEIAFGALNAVGLASLAAREFGTLSGGERQLVLLARALAQQTPCLILDEPTNHLDINRQLQLMGIVKAAERTVVAAIHDLNIAAAYCDELYALSCGSVVAHGSPEEVLTPEIIREIYGVGAELLRTGDNRLQISFYPLKETL
ncbi:MAG: ABC transporter ATP-binding protein [Oscillospiraceae bacterium]|jgi:iron complex transport system ATP-binding protein|nr:ABC transporter ATP-binding protein [Oscillospiraceae bacterium]